MDQVDPHRSVLSVISGDIFKNEKFLHSFRCCEVKEEKQEELVVLRGLGSTLEVENSISIEMELNITQDEEENLIAALELHFISPPEADVPENCNFQCTRYSTFFRTVSLELDVEEGVYSLPTFDTHWHPLLKKAGIERRELDVYKAFSDAGIDLKLLKEKCNIVQDPNPEDKWTTQELHKVLRREWSKVFRKKEDGHLDWKVWVLLGSEAEKSSLMGYMFDYINKYGRNGAAIFSKAHTDLPDWDDFRPHNIKHVLALWDYLFTSVHEIAHMFNLPHTFEDSHISKKCPETLSWMNYPYLYENGNESGKKDFFVKFRFTFDKEELMHLRHGNYELVRPGMSSFKSNSHRCKVTEQVQQDVAELYDVSPLFLHQKTKHVQKLRIHSWTENSRRNSLTTPVPTCSMSVPKTAFIYSDGQSIFEDAFNSSYLAKRTEISVHQ